MTAQSLLGGVLGALFHRERTGQGQLVDAALLRSGAYFISHPLVVATKGPAAQAAIRAERTERGQRPTLNAYRCQDGQWVQMLGLEQNRHLPGLVRALGLKEVFAADPRFDSNRNMNRNK
jgi:crotonobetainyl-CoA:carnitine CoA-transferase CaiB-like acyl-CoA transferase